MRGRWFRLAERPLYEQYRAQIDKLSSLALNFDYDRKHEYTKANGWRIDDYKADLPPEPPGPPLAAGSWAAAKRMLVEYRFPDPSIITGIYYPDQPLAERYMLLRARFLWLTFFFGVKIGGVVDQQLETDAGMTQVWGFNYQTLAGHFERGQMDFAVVKWLDSGQVAFTIHAFSQTAQIANPFYRLGFRLFGRRVQRRFATRSLARMQQLVVEELAVVKQPNAEAPALQPASADPKASTKMEELAQSDA